MYTTYFGFREEPFNVIADPRFLYTNAAYQTAYARLRHGLRERQEIMVLIGEVGSGKTTLLRRLMHDLEATASVVFLDHPTLTFDEFLTAICYELQLPIEYGEPSQKIQALQEFLGELSQVGRTLVLLIDEAQGLSEEILEHLQMLSTLEAVTATSLQIVLVGPPELETRLAQAKLRRLNQDIVVRCKLDRLTDDDVAAYIYHRLRLVGYEQQDLFPEEAIQRIAWYSGGIPRVINTVCDHALLDTCGRSQKTVSAEVIDKMASGLPYLGAPTAEEAPALPAYMAGEPGHTPRTTTREALPGLPRRRRLAWVGGIALLGLVLLGGGSTVVYPQQTQKHLSQLGLKASYLLGSAVERLEVLGRNIHTRLEGFIARGTEADKKVQAPSETAARSGREPFPQARDTMTPQAEDKPSPAPTVSRPGENVSLKQPKYAVVPSPLPPAADVPVVQPAAAASSSAALPSSQLASASTGQERFIKIPPDATVLGIATQTYGKDNTLLGVDLIAETNPHIANLNVVRAGEKLQLPLLTRDTLLRQQPDGTYHLILRAFPAIQRAERFAQDVRLHGYTVVVNPRQLAGNLHFFRVEIGALPTLEAVQHVWDAAVTQHQFILPESP